MRIFGPLVCATTSALTATLASLSALYVTASPSTSRTAGSATSSPGTASSFSTCSRSPTATLYCLPPVLTMAYIADFHSLLGQAQARYMDVAHHQMGRLTGYGTRDVRGKAVLTGRRSRPAGRPGG